MDRNLSVTIMTFMAAQPGQAFILGDARQPGSKCAPTMKGVELVVDLDEYVLGNIQGALGLTGIGIGDPVNEILMALHQLIEGSLGTGSYFIDEI